MHLQRAGSMAPWVLRGSPWDPPFFLIYQIKEIDIFLFGRTGLSGFPLSIRRAHVWRCVECQYPKCKLCDARPEMPVSHNHMEADGSLVLFDASLSSMSHMSHHPETCLDDAR